MTSSTCQPARVQSASPTGAHPVLSPGHLGALHLPNRAVVAPMSRVSATGSGVPTEQMARYYARFAAGGFAAVITEGTYTDPSFAQAYDHQPGLVSDEQVTGWRAVTTAIRTRGAVAIAQLMHAGALSQHLAQTVAPSAVRPRGRKLRGYGGEGRFEAPRAMTLSDIEAAAEGFVQSALRAAAAGFHGVEVHAANGYLLDQFITRYTNLRTDRYGGVAADRARLIAEVIAAIKAATAASAPTLIVGVRLSQTKVNDFEYRWTGRPEAATYFAAVAEAGADYVHLASEGKAWRDTAMLDPQLSATSLARTVTGRSVIANGALHDPAVAASILDGEHADFIAVASGALANPDWPRRLASASAVSTLDPALLHCPRLRAEETSDAWDGEIPA